MNQRALIICGPTASGKSAYAMDLAKREHGAIINADAIQVYKEIPIITASPSVSDKEQIPHYLYNYISVFDEFSISRYLKDAKEAINNAKKAGYLPIIVGGSGMYISALLNGLSNIPDIDSDIRSEARTKFEQIGKELFWKELCAQDSMASNRINQNDKQRMIRAYEVFKQTGQSIFAYKSQEDSGIIAGAKTILLMPEREVV